MKTLKICLVILCLLHVRAVGLPQFSGATFFMEIQVNHKRLGVVSVQYSDVDHEFIQSKKWIIVIEKGKLYAATSYKRSNGTHGYVKMHRLITQCPKNKLVDHKFGHTLDNRRENLRICNNTQNCRNSVKKSTNTSGYKGVYLDNREYLKKRYVAQIFVDRFHIKIGYFKTASEAAIAYNEAAIKYHGEFARLNVL